MHRNSLALLSRGDAPNGLLGLDAGLHREVMASRIVEGIGVHIPTLRAEQTEFVEHQRIRARETAHRRCIITRSHVVQTLFCVTSLPVERDAQMEELLACQPRCKHRSCVFTVCGDAPSTSRNGSA